jgi:hypothetical protein
MMGGGIFMRACVCFLLLAAVPGYAVDNIAGKWSGSMNVSAADGTTQDVALVLVLQQNGSELTGTLTPAGKVPVVIQKGMIDGEKVTFEVHVNPSMKFDGTLSDDNLKFKIEGTVRVNDDDLHFTGTMDLKRDRD